MDNVRPFCFHVNFLESRPVMLTEAKIKTTYAQLLSESTIINQEEQSDGIFPEPLKFTVNLYHLRQRETTGKLKRPAVTKMLDLKRTTR